MLLDEIVRTSEAVAATRSRTRKVAALADVIRRLEEPELAIGVDYLAGRPRQDRLDTGYATLAGLEVPAAGAPTLDLVTVDGALERLTTVGGDGSHRARRAILIDLLGAATPAEQRFLRRLILRELRQGALAGVVVQAIADAYGIDADLVRRATMLLGDLAAAAVLAASEGVDGLRAVRMDLFRPIEPMLAATAPTVEDALGETGAAVVEAKLDGIRVQVHRRGDEVRVYSRNLRDLTAGVPEVVAAARRLAADAVVLDGEALALTPDGRPVPFQETMSSLGADEPPSGRRPPGREHDGPLAARWFDVLHVDGEDLLDEPLTARAAALERLSAPADRVDRLVTADPAEALGFLERTLDAGHEGVVVKDPASLYEAGRRGSAWRKVKPSHTLDLVVLAAEWGSGRRTGWLSNLHLGARDDEAGRFVMLGKTFKGLTDAMLTWQTERLLALETRRTRHVVHVRPELVVEIAFDGVLASTRYPGGVALRFARVKRYREDKDPDQADTIATVRAIHTGRIRPRVATAGGSPDATSPPA